jgi:gamma-glutamyltranspeptidase/glutathione hydrolase
MRLKNICEETRCRKRTVRLILATLILSSIAMVAQQRPGQATLAACTSNGPQLPFCKAVRGDRAEGWLPQSRSEVMARNGMVSTSQPLAAEAGLRILMQGGNAVDAAVATAAALNVVEPMMIGMAGDLFAIVYSAKEHKLYALNASGKAPTGASVAHYASLGYKYVPGVSTPGPGGGMPSAGILTVTVPGTVEGWDQLLKKFGTMTFKQVLEPAAEYAEKGYPVSERIAHDWNIPNALPLSGCCTQTDPDTIAAWTIQGQSPKPGQIFKNLALARSFRLLQQYGRDVFYKGEIARAIVAKSNALGGTMTLQDLANFTAEWTTPATTNYHGYEVSELPPPSQAWATNEMLNILEVCVPKLGYDLAQLGPASPEFWHLLLEAKKLAYSDLFAANGDPNFVTVPLDKLLSKSYAATLCSHINPVQAGPAEVAGNAPGDTIVLSTADRWGNMVSLVNSNYAAFGSGITVPGYGFLLHNRGALFTLNPSSPNVIAPHKQPFNTLSAGFAMKDGQPLLSFQLMGGSQQAQGHMQVLVNLFDLGANLQAASDMARFSHDQATNRLQMESQLYNLIGSQLRAWGHEPVSANGAPMGGFQAIMTTPESDGSPVYRAGSDHRKDGQAVGW